MNDRRAVAYTALAALLLAACAPAAPPAPTQAPAAKPTTAPAPAAKPTEAAKPATSPAASSVSISGPHPDEAKTLNGAGATFPAVLYTKWFDEYFRLTGVQVNYQSIGSGGGIRAITDRTVDFAGSDAPMSDQQLAAAQGEIFHIPAALGAVVATYNVPGINDPLRFTPETLAGIFLGQITKWNDPKLVADNPSLVNSNDDIIVVHRSDGSGTTSIFVDYLSTVSPEWEQRVGRGTSVDWPVGLGGRGNEGVAGEVSQNPYSIGYVELIYALQNNLGVGLIRNKAGEYPVPSPETVTAAAAGVAQTIRPDLRASIVNADGANTYPISGFTWLLAYKEMQDRPKAIALTRMLWWATHEAQRFNVELGYAPVPPAITEKSEAFIRQISVNGQPVFPGR